MCGVCAVVGQTESNISMDTWDLPLHVLYSSPPCGSYKVSQSVDTLVFYSQTHEHVRSLYPCVAA